MYRRCRNLNNLNKLNNGIRYLLVLDLMAMCVNDLIVQWSKPLFFDIRLYPAVGKSTTKNQQFINGIIKGCKISDCKLVGGETAEMPRTDSNENFDLAGFSVGLVSKKKILDKKNVKTNDIVLGIPSRIHSNRYSLVRSVIKNIKISNKVKTKL